MANNKIKETMGVQQGEHFAAKELKLEPIQLDGDKGRPQGFDAVSRDPRSGRYVVIDYKGGPSSKLSTAQNKADYLDKVVGKTLSAPKATQIEKKAARQIKSDLAAGKSVDFLAIKTPSLGKTHVSHKSFVVRPANQKDIARVRLDHKKTSSIGKTSISGWQQAPRKVSRPANDNGRKPPSPQQKKQAQDRKAATTAKAKQSPPQQRTVKRSR